MRAGRRSSRPFLSGGVPSTMTGLVPRATRGPREGNHVPHIGQTRHVGNGSLEAEAKARGGHGSIAPQAAIPAVRVRVQTRFRDPAIEDIEAFLTLRPADD